MRFIQRHKMGTCSITNLKDNCATFARSKEHLRYVNGITLNLNVFAPIGIDKSDLNLKDNITFLESEYFEYDFTIFHNWINKDKHPAEDVIGKGCNIHQTAIVGEGVRLNIGPGGVKAQLKHIGNVIFGDNVIIGPYALIERGCFDSTIIGNGVTIDGLCVIGHNCVIGENTAMASGTGIGGSSIVGKNCWFGTNSTVRNGVKICDNVVLGIGSVIVKDITEPGIYAGVPAVLKKPYTEGWKP
jgi:acetyltransferase-like isoleucine patch superfamily enzyme